MDDWPQSWAAIPADEALGAELVLLFKAFIEALALKGLSGPTIRRHLNNAWCIGGELIRDIHDEPARRGQSARPLLQAAVADGQAPLVHSLSPSQQDSLDATAPKLRAFLRQD
jgi:hypothetical protein